MDFSTYLATKQTDKTHETIARIAGKSESECHYIYIAALQHDGCYDQ